MNIIKFSLRYHQITLTILLLAVLMGVHALFTMPRREDPKITIRQGLVVANFPGATSAQVEEQVTKKIEQYLFTYSEVRKAKTYSSTTDGQVVVYIELAENVKTPDVFWSKLRLDLNQNKPIDLPKGVVGPFVNSDFGDTIAMLISLEDDSLDDNQLKDYLQKVDDGLRTVPGLSKIKHIGEQTDQITVSVKSEKLAQYGVNLQQITQILQAQNAIASTGDIKTSNNQVPLYAQGYFITEKNVSEQVVGYSKSNGEVIKLGEVADIKREPAERITRTTVKGHRALLLSLEMLEGNNIVDFGNAITAKLAALKKQMPPSLKFGTIVNQPEIVHNSVNDFIREFLIAIVSVLIVILLLLPFRIALVAAMAIPVTIAVTFSLLNFFGIELHQVSLAALIIVLGMVVDDAIVIADNYVELLDHGIDRKTAAWRSASDLVVPVFTATITIICSFLPFIIITGTTGEFIFALPITVAIALTSSFVVAMLLTPYLCFVFIKKGLHDHNLPKDQKTKRKSLLDYMQSGYNLLLTWCMNHRKTTILASVMTIVFAVLLSSELKQKFFPAAERNMFVIELWMPTGTKLDKTTEVIKRVENLLNKDSRVVTYATFSGTSAPRFYYNFSPEPPVTNYAQVLVTTHTDKETEELAHNLNDRVNSLMPEGRPYVRLMQQGASTVSPIEVRITGPELGELKILGKQISDIVSNAPGSKLVRSNFHEDYYGLGIKIKEDGQKLGFTSQSIGSSIHAGFTGTSVTPIYESNHPINIVLRMEAKDRRDFNDLANTYVTSPSTGINSPLRQVSEIVPEWQTGRIMHRNGSRTLTVLCEVSEGALASQILKATQDKIAKIPLPSGYSIAYGGEIENQLETAGQMNLSLGISIVLIFLILLFQFKNLKEVFVVMTAIPLSLFGAISGVLITHNPFGFTAFLGIIALSGIVVRNAIILIDHTNELIAEGNDIFTAALESGKRRLRPIFLTAMAAAIGVVPMIVSGSPLWSPLASVIAFGVVFSMVMALLVTPVLFVMIIKPEDKEGLNKSQEKL
ncbi:efflux RND transporter permease subunit [Pedobacter sp. L105]|uniref:efflux RND transporter permease subunit n=1 Tax=Pedobacter sp. L105 TaxID=1641871 RepID=UPI00131D6E6E|nr:efflux RND transporter permease subunit [Pedobacter sp. L105]